MAKSKSYSKAPSDSGTFMDSISGADSGGDAGEFFGLGGEAAVGADSGGGYFSQFMDNPELQGLVGSLIQNTMNQPKIDRQRNIALQTQQFAPMGAQSLMDGVGNPDPTNRSISDAFDTMALRKRRLAKESKAKRDEEFQKQFLLKSVSGKDKVDRTELKKKLGDNSEFEDGLAKLRALQLKG